jgi:hypothetical protein
MSAIPQTLKLGRKPRRQIIRFQEWSGFFFWLLSFWIRGRGRDRGDLGCLPEC